MRGGKHREMGGRGGNIGNIKRAAREKGTENGRRQRGELRLALNQTRRRPSGMDNCSQLKAFLPSYERGGWLAGESVRKKKQGSEVGESGEARASTAGQKKKIVVTTRGTGTRGEDRHRKGGTEWGTPPHERRKPFRTVRTQRVLRENRVRRRDRE